MIPPVRKDEILQNSHGRAPWYGVDGVPIESYVIGIAGGSGSGKTTVAQAILNSLGNISTVLILSQDSFYRKHTQEEIDLAFSSDLDLDHPDAIDMGLFVKCLSNLKKGKATEIPVYSFVHHQRMPEKKYLYGASVIIVEGIMALQSAELRKLYDLKVFVNADSDLMLARRIRRDISERGRTVDGVLDQYLRFVKNSYDMFVLPSAKHADLIVPGAENNAATDILVTHVQRQLDSRSLRFRNKLSQMGSEASSSIQDVSGSPSNVVLLDQTNQLMGIMTILRDRSTERSDFIFYTDRLSSLVVEKGLSMIEYEDAEVETPLGLLYKGKKTAAKHLVGVSVLRSGGPFAKGLRRVMRDVQLASLLIQSEPKTGEPLLLHSSFPECIKDPEESINTVAFILDSQMGTGAAGMMAIRVLLDHGVKETNIIFLTFLVAKQGLATVQRAFPGVRVVTAAIDRDITEMRFPIDDSTELAMAVGDGDVAEIAPENFKDLDELRFSRPPKEARADTDPTEKRAWAITPGAGHIGNRYYLQ